MHYLICQKPNRTENNIQHYLQGDHFYILEIHRLQMWISYHLNLSSGYGCLHNQQCRDCPEHPALRWLELQAALWLQEFHHHCNQHHHSQQLLKYCWFQHLFFAPTCSNWMPEHILLPQTDFRLCQM